MADIDIDRSENIKEVLSNSLPGMEVVVAKDVYSGCYRVKVIDRFFAKNAWRTACVEVGVSSDPTAGGNDLNHLNFTNKQALDYINQELRRVAQSI
ncbi:hypothetical protein NK638_00260 [Psychrobacter sp. A3]|uniref:hypothetical protein n=1 Tax=Psychrobacter sp. A3 TaxID=2992754 RepID=UPI00237AAD17|nr:hypothetical protein [Psychrobacter sp. A3]MDE0489991.1 hypothetical protein [Psychrobacter sp. A3]